MRKLIMFLCMIIATVQLSAQQRTISGVVTDANGNPLSNVTVGVRGTGNATITSANGSFTLNVPASATHLEISYVGFTSQTIDIKGKTTIGTIRLAPETSELEGVVVTGIKNVKRSEFAGAASKISSAEIENRPVGSFDQVIQGKVPGVTALTSSGQPGQPSNVIIRGQGSITGGTSPLYIVDGIPVEEGVFQGYNPNDFASMDVLRDATAAALYGSRGSAGVIVVTTKRGKAGKLQFSYSGQYGVKSRPEFTWDMMTTPELLKAQEEYGNIVGGNSPSIPGWFYSKKNPAYQAASPATQAQYDQILDSLSKINTDWRDVFFRRGTYNNHQITLSGGSGNTRIYSSLALYNEEGTTMRTDMKRITLRNNVDYVGDRLKLSISSNLGYVKRNFQQTTTTNSLGNPFLVANIAAPYVKAYNDDGSIAIPTVATYQLGTTRWAGVNALDLTHYDMNYNDQFKATLGLEASYSVTKEISIGLTSGVDFRETQGTAYGSRLALSRRASSTPTGKAGFQNEALTRFITGNIRPSISYRKIFAERHDVDLSIYGEFIQEAEKSVNFTGYGIDPRTPNTPAAITQGNANNQLYAVVGGGKGESSLYSGLFMARYTFDNKYTLNASFRRDASSKLPEANRWTNFYSIGGVWDVMKEKFMNVRAINTLRVKLSYGTSGNSNNFPGGYYPYQGSYAASGNYSGLPLQVATYPGNEGLRWETVHLLNLGIDYGFLKNRIYGDINLYDKRTKDLFVSQTLSATSGFGNLDVNAGELQNKGVEVTLNIDVIRKKDFNATVFGNFSYNKNKVLSLGGLDSWERGTELVKVGMPLGSHYEVKWGGVDAATGAPLYYTEDGKLTTDYNAAPAVQEFGTWEAPWKGGFGFNVSYKFVELSTLFSWQRGATKVNNLEYFMENAGPSFLGAGFNQANTLNFWKNPGDITSSPSPKFGTNFSSKIIHKADFLRLRDVTLSFSLPKNVVDRARILSNAKLYFQGFNLITWTNWVGMDPEAGAVNINLSEYPNPKGLTVGLNVTFK